MKISIHQPSYLTWLGLLQRIKDSDIHIFLDHVQFEKNSFVNRNKILTPDGPIWLSIPTEKGKPICETQITDSRWIKKHLKSIENSYSKQPFFDKYYPELKTSLEFYASTNLGELNLSIMRLFLKWFGIETTCFKSSLFKYATKKSDLVLDICCQLEADTYFSGINGKDYLNLKSFEAAGIKVEFQDYEHPIYYQTKTRKLKVDSLGVQQENLFIPNLTALDLLFREGEESRRYLN